jgi:hypothetical protein
VLCGSPTFSHTIFLDDHRPSGKPRYGLSNNSEAGNNPREFAFAVFLVNEKVPQVTRADVLLRESLTMLAPLARALVSHGVTYPVFAQALKRVFLDAARSELLKDEKKITDSALSLLSGVHRKDVRVMTDEELAEESAAQRAWSLASEVVTRWLTQPDLEGPDGAPRPLPLRGRGDEMSFEKLSQSVSKDFHARSVLDELRRLGLAQVNDEIVSLTSDLFMPTSGFMDRAHYFGQNVRDHVAACATNLTEQDGEPPFLEYAVFADHLSPTSTHQLHLRARQLWMKAFRQIISEATSLAENDQLLPPAERSMRMRFGVFFYDENMGPAAIGDVASEDSKE